MKRYFSLFLILALICCLFTGCGASAEADKGYDNFYAADAPIEMGRYPDTEYVKGETMPAQDGRVTSNSVLSNTETTDRKLIKIVYLYAESKDYDTLLSGLDTTILELGGYVESRDQNNSGRRSCSITIRIPADRLSEFVTHMEDHANVLTSSETATDVTLEYVDTEAKVKALETEQARLLELLAKAESLKDILEIEARLGDVTYELERFASRLRSLDNKVNYATVNLSLREVEVLTPRENPTVWERISTGFSESLSDLGKNLTDAFVWVIVESPNLVVWCVILLAVRFLVKRFKKPLRKKKAVPPPQSE